MNFVIFTRNFYPQNNPEAYCSTRFASALAAIGHNVHVITVDHGGSDERYARLVNPALKITRLKTQWRHFGPVKSRWNYLSRLHLNPLALEDGDIHNYHTYVKVVKKILAKYEDPILVTRSLPDIGYRVGLGCYRHAKMWIAHLSDPIPAIAGNSHYNKLYNWLTRRHLRQVFNRADGVSVTCSRVIRWFHETLGDCVDERKCFVTTHIGDFKLDGDEKKKTEPSNNGERYIYHDGDIYSGRGLSMVDAVDQLNAEGFKCRFIQGRAVRGESDRARLLASDNCSIVGRDAPPEQKALAANAQVSFVADFDMPGLPYSAHLMSKFVYQLFTDKPIVVLSKLESEKHDYCEMFPEAGLFFAKLGDLESLKKAIRDAFACDPSEIDRSRIREVFSETSIGEKFIRDMEGLTHGKCGLCPVN